MAFKQINQQKDQSIIYPQGNHTWTIDRGHLAAGIYFYRLQSQGQQVIDKMIVANP